MRAPTTEAIERTAKVSLFNRSTDTRNSGSGSARPWRGVPFAGGGTCNATSGARLSGRSVRVRDFDAGQQLSLLTVKEEPSPSGHPLGRLPARLAREQRVSRSGARLTLARSTLSARIPPLGRQAVKTSALQNRRSLFGLAGGTVKSEYPCERRTVAKFLHHRSQRGNTRRLLGLSPLLNNRRVGRARFQQRTARRVGRCPVLMEELDAYMGSLPNTRCGNLQMKMSRRSGESRCAREGGRLAPRLNET